MIGTVLYDSGILNLGYTSDEDTSDEDSEFL